eukprot:515347-Pelagomonas_calceolata.AAC.4
MLPLKCIAVQGSMQLDFVRFSPVATAFQEYGINDIMCLAHLHKQDPAPEQCSYPAATLLQLHCCRHLVHAIVLDRSYLSGQIEDDCPCGIAREAKK